ncbi:MAG: GIN domain-containing protein [Lutibacter sp.]
MSVSGAFDVNLVKGKEGAISIEAEENLMEYIETEVENGLLKIQPKKDYQLKSTKTIVITVPFETMDAVSLAGSGNVEIHAVSEIHAKIVGSGDVIYSGNPTIEKVKSVGSGSIRKKN